MDIKELKFLWVCQYCGCVFHKLFARPDWIDPCEKVLLCPACKHKHEIPKKSTK
jgi:hypothetical protein